MVPVRFKPEIQYEPALVSVKVQYLARTGRCARFVSVGLYFDISSPRLSILDTVRCAFARAPHRHTHVQSTLKMCIRARATQTHTCNTYSRSIARVLFFDAAQWFPFPLTLMGKRPARHLRPFCFHCCPGRLSRAPSRDTSTGKMAVLF